MVSMADNQVDRVALAICNAERKAKCLTMAASLSEVLGEHHYRELARVAIAAMPEPVEAVKAEAETAKTFAGFPLPILFVGGYQRDVHVVARAVGLSPSQWRHCQRVDRIKGINRGTFVMMRAVGDMLHAEVVNVARHRALPIWSERSFMDEIKEQSKTN
jgi:hypothetical protein